MLYSTFEEVLARPATTPLPITLSDFFGTVDTLRVCQISAEQLEKMLPYVFRLSLVYQVVLLREIIRTNKHLCGAPAVKTWLLQHPDMLDTTLVTAEKQP